MDLNEQITRELHSTTDAQVWAKRFASLFIVLNREDSLSKITGDELEGLMIGWFANAIEVGRSAGLRADKIEIKDK